MKFVEFVQRGDAGNPIYVNPGRVQYVCIDAGDTRIVFNSNADEDQAGWIEVRGTIAEVIKKLERVVRFEDIE